MAYETEISPTVASRMVVDRPLAVVDNVNTVSPVTYWVSVDHLNRPIQMTNIDKASVWSAVWLPWGGVQSITGVATLNTRLLPVALLRSDEIGSKWKDRVIVPERLFEPLSEDELAWLSGEQSP